jgi:hypothetical protein
LLPPPGQTPRFAQIYVYDPDFDVQIRQRMTHDALNETTLRKLQIMLNQHNKYIHLYRTAGERIRTSPDGTTIALCFVDPSQRTNHRRLDLRRYNKPVQNEVGLIIEGDDHDLSTLDDNGRDIIVQTRHTGSYKRINETHREYLPFRYPLIFTHGEPGWFIGKEANMFYSHS